MSLILNSKKLSDLKKILWSIWMNVFECICVHTRDRALFVFLDYIRSVSLPVQLQTEATGSSSSEPGSVSPDCDSKQDVFFEKKKRSGSENLLKPLNSNFLRWAQTMSTKVNTEPNKGPQTGPDEFRSRAGQRVYVCADVSVGLASGMLMTWLCLRSWGSTAASALRPTVNQLPGHEALRPVLTASGLLGNAV